MIDFRRKTDIGWGTWIPSVINTIGLNRLSEPFSQSKQQFVLQQYGSVMWVSQDISMICAISVWPRPVHRLHHSAE